MSESGLPEPTWRMLLGRGLPNLALEGVLPVLLFYVVWREVGLGPAVVASTAAAGLVVIVQMRRGLDVALAAVTCLFIVIQAIVGLAANSATVYLAQPVVVSGLWGIAYLGSVAICKPLIGAFARAWYPFPPEFRASAVYRREFSMQSIVWGVYCLARCGLRLWVLLAAGVGGLLVVSTVTGTPIIVALALWGVWHARRVFSAAVSDDEWDADAAEQPATATPSMGIEPT